MTAVPDEPTVLDTTILSNFAYIGQLPMVEALPRVCTVPAVQSELRAGVDSHPYLQRALDSLGETIPVIETDQEAGHGAADSEPALDAGEAAAYAVAEGHGGTLVTDDGQSRRWLNAMCPVTGSLGVLVRAVECGRVTEAEADRWLKRWIDETDYRAPSRELSDYL